MLKTRLIPMLFLKNGLIVRSEKFSDFRELGDPISQLARLNEWQADELIYVDITREGEYDLKRDDLKIKNKTDIISILEAVARSIFTPLTFGGRIRELSRVKQFMAHGADKVIVNTGVYKNPKLITEIAHKYGSQAMVCGIDVKNEDGKYVMYIENGRTRVADDPVEYAKKVEGLGAGEIFLNSIDRDGTAKGYDIPIIKLISDNVRIPVIAAGGAGSFDDFVKVAKETGVSAIAAGNIFNFTERAYIKAKKCLKDAGVMVR